MEKFEISVSYNEQNHHFEVKDYMHHEGEQCKYEIFKEGTFIASFEPGAHRHLNICKDAGIAEEALLDRIADELERFNI